MEEEVLLKKNFLKLIINDKTVIIKGLLNKIKKSVDLINLINKSIEKNDVDNLCSFLLEWYTKENPNESSFTSCNEYMKFIVDRNKDRLVSIEGGNDIDINEVINNVFSSIEDINNNIDNLMNSKDKLKLKNDSLVDLVSNIEETKDNLEKEKNELQQQKTKLEEENNELQQQKKQLEQEKIQLSNGSNVLTEENINRFNELTEKINQINEKLKTNMQ